MEEIKLDVNTRVRLGSRGSKEVRKEDHIPAVVYGGDRGPTTIKVERQSFERILRQHQGESILFHLTVLEEGKKLRDYSALVKDVQQHSVTGEIVHIDFIRVSLKEEIEVMVPLVLVGEPEGVKKDGGTLDQTMRELAVVCLPTNMPQNLEVDVNSLGLHESVYVKDVALPQGVTTNHDFESVIATVAGAVKEAEPQEEGEAPTEPEVTSEKKSEESSEEPKADGGAEEKKE